MTILPQTAASAESVSYALLLTHAARRIAARIHLDPAPLETAARRAYRATHNHHAAIRAVRVQADAMRGAGAGVPA